MRSSEVAQAIRDAIAINVPLMIWGAPGIGKSDSVRQAAKALGIELIDYRAALRDAVDIMGLPFIKGGPDNSATHYALPAGLPTDPNWRGIIFLDELVSAPAQVQAAMYQLVLDRAVGDYRLPKGAFIVAAGNRANDRGVVHRMPDPLADRFIHVTLTVHLGDWCAWAIDNKIAAEVVAFVRFRESLLHLHDPKRECVAFATPRGWADVSKVLGLNSPVEMNLIQGRVGDAAAGEFKSFLTLFRQMVSPDQILLNPLAAEVPTNPSILYALAEALARRATEKNLGSVLAYAERMPKEYMGALMSSATRATPSLTNTPEFIQWAARYQ